MPVTAKLSRKFYERFGDEITSELVDWFNAVDLNYQTQLREINDLDSERFKATLLAEGAAIRGEMRAGLAELRTEIHAMRAELIKWMFVFSMGSIVTLGGLMFTVFGAR